MVDKVVLSTVGFSAELVMRSALRVGIGSRDRVVLIYSMSGDEHSRKRVGEAVETVKKLLHGVGVIVEDCVVTGTDFFEDVTAVLKVLKSYRDKEIIVSLTGGMRITIFAVFYAAELLARLLKVRVTIHLMREDGLYDVFLSAPLVPMLGRGELTILRYLKEFGFSGRPRPRIVEELAKNMRVSETAVRKVFNGLETKGLVQVSDGMVVITKLGEVVYEILKGV